jgi:hypothetical protein
VFADAPSSSEIMVNGSDDSDKTLSTESDEEEIQKESPPRDSPDKRVHVRQTPLRLLPLFLSAAAEEKTRQPEIKDGAQGQHISPTLTLH